MFESPTFVFRNTWFYYRMLGLLLLGLTGLQCQPSRQQPDLFQQTFDQAEVLRSNGQYQAAEQLYLGLLAEARDQQNKRNEAYCLQSLGLISQEQDRFDECIQYYSAAAKISKEINEPSILALSRLNQGIVFKKRGDRAEAIQALKDAVLPLRRLVQEYPDDPYYPGDLASCYNSLGDIYTAEGLYEEAAQSLHEALRLWKVAEDTFGMASTFNFLGELHLHKGTLDSAAQYFQLSLSFKQREGNPGRLASTFSNLGDLEKQKGNQLASGNYYRKAYQLQVQSRDLNGQVLSARKIAGHLLDKNTDSALFFLHKSSLLADSLGLKEELLKNFSLWRQYYAAIGRQDSVIAYLDRMRFIDQELNEVNKQRAEVSARILMETDLKDAELENLRIQSENTRTTNIGLFILVIILTLFILVVYNSYRQKQKGERKVRFLMKELNHRVKNNLQVLSSLFALQTEQFKGTPAYAALQESESRVRAMAMIHRRLYMDEQITRVDMHDFITQLTHGLMEAYGFDEQQLNLTIRVEEELMEVEKALPLGLILNELVSNAFKYAFTEANNPVLTIELQKLDMGANRLRVMDNGPGVPDTVTLGTTFGQRLIQGQCRQLKAVYSYQYKEGAVFEVLIPGI